MPLGETVDAVVEEDHIHVYVSSHEVDEVVPANSQGITISTHEPYAEVGVGCLYSGGNRSAATMYGVHPVGAHVVGQSRRAADAGYYDHVLRSDPYVAHGTLEGIEHGMVPTSGTPLYRRAVGEVLGGYLTFCLLRTGYGQKFVMYFHSGLLLEDIDDIITYAADEEGLTLHFIHSEDIESADLSAEVFGKLSQALLDDNDFLIPSEYFCCVGG